MTDNPWQAWIGRSETATCRADGWPLVALAAALDGQAALADGAPLPALAHWCYFVPTAAQAQLGPDGHPPRGGLIPPLVQPRRMWAGSEITFHAPLRLGGDLVRSSTVADVATKAGSSGPLVFLRLRHDWRDGQDTPLLSEVQTLVYRDPPDPDEGKPR
ncbi:MAG: MaoC family dehydratase N-terminal domain-containing protein, partial [Rhodobacterales bacterium]|nr:MaoC family dehydratase N-terminal domain-containing protein [Rhodobacterales bacterium]